MFVVEMAVYVVEERGYLKGSAKERSALPSVLFVDGVFFCHDLDAR
jgi:hypothetical protein